jgi:hypothetical protein
MVRRRAAVAFPAAASMLLPTPYTSGAGQAQPNMPRRSDMCPMSTWLQQLQTSPVHDMSSEDGRETSTLPKGLDAIMRHSHVSATVMA